jgi:hypothetical protein
MPDFKAISEKIKDALGFHYFPIAMHSSDEYPKDAINSNQKFHGCIFL